MLWEDWYVSTKNPMHSSFHLRKLLLLKFHKIQIIFLLIILSGPILADSIYSDNTESKFSNIWELGFRYGAGFRYKDRFERDLENFSSTFQPGVVTKSTVNGFRHQNFGETFLRMAYSDNQRFGFSIGRLDYHPFSLRELASDGYITQLDFSIQTLYVIFTYHYVWSFTRSLSLEAGLGFGGNETRWDTKGWSIGQRDFFPQQGRLRGNGISLRLENSLHYRINDGIFLQIGWIGALHSVPSFSGVWNGAAATFFIREDGKTAPIAESKLADNIIASNQFIRALDMNAAHWGIHFSIGTRFSY